MKYKGNTKAIQRKSNEFQGNTNKTPMEYKGNTKGIQRKYK
jgi:hypothetical protein